MMGNGLTLLQGFIVPVFNWALTSLMRAVCSMVLASI
jgi:hypothetical protein